MRRNKTPWMRAMGNDFLFFNTPRDRRFAIGKRVVVYLISGSAMVGILLIVASLR